MALLITCALYADAKFVNIDVERKIDVKGIVELSTTTIKMRNIGDKEESTFAFSVNPRGEQKVGDIFAVQGNSIKANKANNLKITKGKLPHTYIVEFQEPVSPSDETTVTLQVDILTSLKPVPPQIKAKELQYMRYQGDAYFYSPYETERMKTTLLFPAAKLTSVLDAPEPHKLKPYQLALGPYEKVEAFASKPLSIRFENSRGFLVARRALLEYHVSHWGAISVREEFTMVNAAAKLVGEWSRADYNRNRGIVDATSHGDVWTNLPADADHISYKDLIGNITTSRLRKPSRGYRALQLTFRFPMQGGWRNHFWYTYNLALDNYVKTTAERHVLTLPALPSLHYDLPCDEYVVRVVLPEGASDIELPEHPTIDFTVSRESTHTTLSYFGRPTLVMTRRNIRSQAPHVRDLVVHYSFSRSKLLIAPALVAGGFLAFCLAFAVFMRTNLVLVHDTEGEKRQRSVRDEVEKIATAHASIYSNYFALQQLYNDVCRGAAANVDEKRARIADNIKKQERVLGDIGHKLRSLNSAIADKLQTLSGLLTQKREISMNFLNIENSFHSSEMSKTKYEEELRRMSPLSQTLSIDVADLFQSIIASK